MSDPSDASASDVGPSVSQVYVSSSRVLSDASEESPKTNNTGGATTVLSSLAAGAAAARRRQAADALGVLASPAVPIGEVAGDEDADRRRPGASPAEALLVTASMEAAAPGRAPDEALIPPRPGRPGGKVPRMRPPSMLDVGSHTSAGPEASPDRTSLPSSGPGRRPKLLTLATPSSCASVNYRMVVTPGTPDPLRTELKLVAGDVSAVLFDFDGTLTASPGDCAMRGRKQVELKERAGMLSPRLRSLRDASLTLGIISKSSENTIRGAIAEAGLVEYFNGPILGSAVGFDGKAGFIDEMVRVGALRHLGFDGLRRVLLVDDDVRELDRARQRGIQIFAAPQQGGLQDEDFDELFDCLGLAPRSGSVSALPTPPPLPSLGGGGGGLGAAPGSGSSLRYGAMLCGSSSNSPLMSPSGSGASPPAQPQTASPSCAAAPAAPALQAAQPEAAA